MQNDENITKNMKGYLKACINSMSQIPHDTTLLILTVRIQIPRIKAIKLRVLLLNTWPNLAACH